MRINQIEPVIGVILPGFVTIYLDFFNGVLNLRYCSVRIPELRKIVKSPAPGSICCRRYYHAVNLFAVCKEIDGNGGRS